MDFARETYLVAWGSAALIAADGASLEEISRAVDALPPSPVDPRPIDLVLDGCARLVTEGRAAAIPLLQQRGAGHRGPPRAGRADLGLAGDRRQLGHLGRRADARHVHPGGGADPRGRRPDRAADPPHLPGGGGRVDRRLRCCRRDRRRGGPGRGCDRHPARAQCQADALRAAGRGGRGLAADRHDDGAGRRGASADGRHLRELGGRHPLQRAGQVRAGVGGGPGVHADRRALGLGLGAARARGGRSTRSARRRSHARPWSDWWTRPSRATPTGPPGISARSRALLSDGAAPSSSTRGGRAARPDPAAARAGPRPSAVRRVAAPAGSTGRCARPVARGVRPVRLDRHGGVRASALGASCSRPARPCASGPPRRRPATS